MTIAEQVAALRERCQREGRAATYEEAWPILCAVMDDAPISMSAARMLGQGIGASAGSNDARALGLLCRLLAEVLVTTEPATSEALAALASCLLWARGVDVEAVRHLIRQEQGRWQTGAAVPFWFGHAEGLVAALEQRDADVARLQAQLAIDSETVLMVRRRLEAEADRADAAEAATREASRQAFAVAQERDALHARRKADRDAIHAMLTHSCRGVEVVNVDKVLTVLDAPEPVAPAGGGR